MVEVEKLNALMELLDNYIEGNKKILVFSQFTSALKNIEQNLEEKGINYIYLDGSIGSKERVELVKKFNEEPLISVFLISLKAGGVGLNLTSASVVIHLDHGGTQLLKIKLQIEPIDLGRRM